MQKRNLAYALGIFLLVGVSFWARGSWDSLKKSIMTSEPTPFSSAPMSSDQSTKANESSASVDSIPDAQDQNVGSWTPEDWKKRLSPEEYRVLRQQGTERPHTGAYDQHWDAGTYVCKGCGAELFVPKPSLMPVADGLPFTRALPRTASANYGISATA